MELVGLGVDEVNGLFTWDIMTYSIVILGDDTDSQIVTF